MMVKKQLTKQPLQRLLGSVCVPAKSYTAYKRLKLHGIALKSMSLLLFSRRKMLRMGNN